MRRLRVFLDFEKEEAWLQDMASRGWLLDGRGFGYRFRRVAPGPVAVRVDARGYSLSRADFDDYRTLFADAGWQHLAGSRWGGAQYFASFAGDPDADIFSDSPSRAARYRRALVYRGWMLFPLLIIVFTLWSQGSLAPLTGDLYLTPGLWEKTGAAFVGAFLFETPFVLLRTGGFLLLVVTIAVLLVQQALQWRLYDAARRVGS